MPFEQGYCLARLVIEHGGGPFAPERGGTMSLNVFKALAAEDLVLVTSEFSERLRPEVELTISARCSWLTCGGDREVVDCGGPQ